MRQDIVKVITEKGRIGWGPAVKYHKRIKWQGEDFDYGPTFVSFSRKRLMQHKDHSDKLNPLKRFLIKNAGRQYNDIYSEICEVVDKRTLARKHFLTHLNWYVSQNVIEVKGYFHEIKWNFSYLVDFYVHPDTGILHYQNRRLIELNQQKEKRKKISNIINISFSGETYEYIEGFWYYIRKYETPRFGGYKELPDGVVLSVKQQFKTIIAEKRRLTDEELIKNNLRNINSKFKVVEKKKKKRWRGVRLHGRFYKPHLH